MTNPRTGAVAGVRKSILLSDSTGALRDMRALCQDSAGFVLWPLWLVVASARWILRSPGELGVHGAGPDGHHHQRSDDTTGFVVLPRRWVAERLGSAGCCVTAAWYATRSDAPNTHEAMVLWATIAIMTWRLAHATAGAPPHLRWGGPRAVASAPEQQDQQAV
jgi:hypothetical protein